MLAIRWSVYRAATASWNKVFVAGFGRTGLAQCAAMRLNRSCARLGETEPQKHSQQTLAPWMPAYGCRLGRRIKR